MKANTKYTAIEILTEAGFEKPEEKIGKFRVIIGGIQGIVTPDHVIRIPAGTKQLDVVIGIEAKVIKIKSDNKDMVISDGARAKLDSEGQERIKNAEKLEKLESKEVK